jgi:hypothetical protein
VEDRGERRRASLHPHPWQEGTSKFATKEMKPKRGQRCLKETVSDHV